MNQIIGRIKMKTYEQIKQEASDYFDANFKAPGYTEYEKNLFVLGYSNGYLKAQKELTPLDKRDENTEDCLYRIAVWDYYSVC